MLGPVWGKLRQVAVGSCSTQHHNGGLRTSSSRGAACPAESKNKLLLLSQSSRPLPQNLVSVLCPRGGDSANGNCLAFCLRSSHHHGEVAQKIQKRPFKGHSGLSFKRDFLTCVCVHWAQAKELRANSREAEKLLPHQVSHSHSLPVPIPPPFFLTQRN